MNRLLLAALLVGAPVLANDPAPAFPAAKTIDGPILHALCVAASLPVGDTGTGHRGIGVLAPQDDPTNIYAWVWIDAQALTPSSLESYGRVAPRLKFGVLGYAPLCERSTPKMKAHTIITFVVEKSDKSYLVIAGTAAATTQATVQGSHDDARRAAVKMAREVSGEMLTWFGSVDGQWGEAFAVPRKPAAK